MSDARYSRTKQSERLSLFAQTVQQLEADFGGWETPWGEVNRYQRMTGDIVQSFDDDAPSLPIGMASGRWGALASYGARVHLSYEPRPDVFTGYVAGWAISTSSSRLPLA